MHPRNRYAQPHDFPTLTKTVPELAQYLIRTPDGRTSLDFTDPEAVRLLNTALLTKDYGLKHWRIPQGNLCPGVPGRLDYIHVIADLLEQDNSARAQVQNKLKKQSVRGLDVGTGASLIYPILGVKEYGWRMVGTDVDPVTLKVATAIANFNPGLKNRVTVRPQPDVRSIFNNVILPGEYFDFTMCNPPFFASPEAAAEAAGRKWEKLGKNTKDTPTLNFGGQANELWTEGGEPAFLRRMIQESVAYGPQVGWFTTLVSKKGYLKIAEAEFGRRGIITTKVIGVGQGGKIRRVLGWQVDT